MSRASSRPSLWHSCRRQIPNALTTIRLLLLIPFVSFLLHGERVYAAGVYLLAIVTDIDGTIARRMKTTSTFGSFFDPAVDALFMVTALFLLVADGSVWLVPVALYWVSALFRLIPALLHYKQTRKVRTTYLSKTIAFSGFTSVFLGTLQVSPLITAAILCVGTVANIILASYWLRGH